MALVVLFVAALWAGVQNALAGGGSFVTLPALMFSGLDPRAANIASTPLRSHPNPRPSARLSHFTKLLIQ